MISLDDVEGEAADARLMIEPRPPPRRLTAPINKVAVTVAEIVPIANSLRSILFLQGRIGVN